MKLKSKFKFDNHQNEIQDFSHETPQQTAIRNASLFKFSQNKAIAKVQKYFKFDTLGATLKKEVLGGFVTFLAMAYILSINPAIVGQAVSITDGTTMNMFGIFLATAIVSFVGTLIMGLFANVPVAVSSTMGMNAMFTYNIAGTMLGGANIGYEGALIATMFSSILFVILSVTPLRGIVIRSIPKGLIMAIGISIGVFIAYVGFADMGWYAMSNGLPVASLAKLKAAYPMLIIGMGTLFFILFLHYKKVPGAVAIGILFGLVICIIVGNALPDTNQFVSQTGGLANANFSLVGHGWDYDFGGFTSNLNKTWSQFVNPQIWNKPTMYISMFVILVMNFFDATGTLSSFNVRLNKRTNQHHDIPSKALAVDSGSALIGSLVGTSPVGAFVESASGIEQGARTGFASIITSLLFLLSIALFPIFKAIPLCVSATACVFIGLMMISEITEIEWKKPEHAVPTFFTLIFMITTYTIANGMAMGFIAYTAMMIITGKAKQVPLTMWVLTLVMLGYLVALAFM